MYFPTKIVANMFFYLFAGCYGFYDITPSDIWRRCRSQPHPSTKDCRHQWADSKIRDSRNLGFADSGCPKNKTYSLNRFPSHGGFSIGKIKNHLKHIYIYIYIIYLYIYIIYHHIYTCIYCKQTQVTASAALRPAAISAGAEISK